MAHHSKGQPSDEEMKGNKVPLAFRDQCAGLLIDLNKCRFENYYLPWKCEHERHVYEVCEYEEYLERLKGTRRGEHE